MVNPLRMIVVGCRRRLSPVEIDAMSVVDEAVENGVGIGRVADHLVPFVDGDLAGEDGRAAAVAFFEDFVEIVGGRRRRADRDPNRRG